MTEQSDLLILGGGIAGMTAAIYAARANLRTTILETNICGGLVNRACVVENFPSHAAIHGMELMERVRQQVEGLGVGIDEACEDLGVNFSGPTKNVSTEPAGLIAPAAKRGKVKWMSKNIKITICDDVSTRNQRPAGQIVHGLTHTDHLSP